MENAAIGRYQGIVLNRQLWQVAEVALITTVLSVVTKLTMDQAAKLTNWKIAPLKGDVAPNLAFATLVMAYISFSIRQTSVPTSVNLYQFLTQIREEEFKNEDKALVRRNVGQYGAKGAILAQLNDPRYQRITLNSTPRAEGNTGDELFQLLTATHGLSEERAVRVLNQLEYQMFADPTVDISRALFPVLPTGAVAQKEEGKSMDLTITETHFQITGKCVLEFKEGETDLCDIEVTVQLSIPKDEAGEESGSYTWKVSDVKDFINQ
ncbi:MAG: hypothetical protein KDK64_02140 [Chlamydiia bacterium]|nr:hypothetical protein [Chlamydiia bacterium]